MPLLDDSTRLHRNELHIIPDFLSASEQASLLSNLARPGAPWQTVSGRQLQNYGGHPHEKGMLAVRLPRALEAVARRIDADGSVFGMRAQDDTGKPQPKNGYMGPKTEPAGDGKERNEPSTHHTAADADHAGNGVVASVALNTESGINNPTIEPADICGPSKPEKTAEMSEKSTEKAEKNAEKSGKATKIEINHALVNAYRPDQGILAHFDGPLYEPMVAIVSMGAPCVMEFVTSGCGSGSSMPASASGSGSCGNGSSMPASASGSGSGSAAAAANNETTEATVVASVILLPGSLLVFKKALYERHMHRIRPGPIHNVGPECLNPSAATATDAAAATATDASTATATGSGGGIVDRGSATRVSITFRNVKKVLKTRIRL
jgi:alkylated DNA repair protein alkB family protein 6